MIRSALRWRTIFEHAIHVLNIIVPHFILQLKRIGGGGNREFGLEQRNESIHDGRF